MNLITESNNVNKSLWGRHPLGYADSRSHAMTQTIALPNRLNMQPGVDNVGPRTCDQDNNKLYDDMTRSI
jgi:hypothetical protein